MCCFSGADMALYGLSLFLPSIIDKLGKACSLVEL
jgi:hypothetical protein